ncbi:MAG: FHA domain-containing protein [Pirellulaceae bacterium]
MDIQLILDHGKQAGRATPLSLGVYLVGRSKSCQIRPKSSSVSRKHCAIVHKSDNVLLQDIGSKHGTFVNDERLERGVAVSLADGDRIRVGKVRFRIAIAAPQAAPSKSAKRSPTRTSKKHKRTEHASALVTSAPNSAVKTGHNQRKSGKPKSDRREQAQKPQQPIESAAATPAHAENPGQPEHVIDDILSLIQGDASDVDNSDVDSSAIDMLPLGKEASIDLDDIDNDNSDGDVEFAAPRSNESLPEKTPVPSYQLRHDWDVSSVQEFVGKKKEAPAQPTRKFKLKHASKAQKAKEKEREQKIRKLSGQPARSLPPWLAWIESGIAGPILVGLFGIALLAWIGYNIYLLYSFKG